MLNCSGLCLIQAMTMTATMPVNSVWVRKTTRLCCLLLRRPLVVSSCQLVVASPLIILSLLLPLVALSCQLVVALPLAPSYRCATLVSSFCASLFLHCLASSSCCTTLSSSCHASWLLCCLLTHYSLVVSLSCRAAGTSAKGKTARGKDGCVPPPIVDRTASMYDGGRRGESAVSNAASLHAISANMASRGAVHRATSIQIRSIAASLKCRHCLDSVACATVPCRCRSSASANTTSW